MSLVRRSLALISDRRYDMIHTNDITAGATGAGLSRQLSVRFSLVVCCLSSLNVRMNNFSFFLASFDCNFTVVYSH